MAGCYTCTGIIVNQRTVVIISGTEADQQRLQQVLDSANPRRFTLVDGANYARPTDALNCPDADAIILSHAPETEYLLRLADRNEIAIPIILLVDKVSDTMIQHWRGLGAQDYMLRSELDNAMVCRILDYNCELKNTREIIKKLSSHDPLTGALNRAGFRAHLERSIERSQRYGSNTAVLYINIDQFTLINDHCGESAGDEMIRGIADRLLSKLRSTDSIARLGGDEFGIVLEDIDARDDVEAIANKMLGSLAAPMTLEGHQVSVSASIGSACYPADAETFSPLVECARHAMREAKATQGSRLVCYSANIAFNQTGKATLAAELRKALRNNQFEVYYQPRVELETGKMRGLEALLRWNHPERGLLCPKDFIGTCEDMGLLKIIGYQVISQACAALKWLDQNGMDDVEVAVNLSFSQIEEDSFVDIVKGIIERNDIDASRLEFELTEGRVLQRADQIRARMEALCDAGISFSLDDFGTGFSQLSHITDLPISVLKIDASFLREVPQNLQQETVCAMIIEMAKRLDMLVVAEGAETHEQVEFLRHHKCSQVQGFYFSPAIPLERVPRFVQQQRWQRQAKLIR